MGITIPPPNDHSALRAARERFGVAEDDIVLIFVGGICERKDPFFLVRQLPETLAASPRVKIMLVGPFIEPEYYMKIMKYLRENKMGGYVIFTDEVRDPYPLFRISDVMVFPSWMEGLPAAVIEAMAHELPVVARHIPGVNDSFIVNGETGFLFADEQDYLKYLKLLLDNPGLRTQIGENARRYAVDHFDVMSIAKKYLDLYDRLSSRDPSCS